MQPGSSLRIILTLALLLEAHVVWGADIWREDFVGAALSQPPGWLDETQESSFNAEIFYSHTPSYAAITRTAEGTQGSVSSPAITCNVNSYENIKISIISVGSTPPPPNLRMKPFLIYDWKLRSSLPWDRRHSTIYASSLNPMRRSRILE